jgi:hypothetical protein
MPEHNLGDQLKRQTNPENAFRVKSHLRTFAILVFAWAVSVTALLTLGSVNLHAQMNAATLNGTVIDPTGAAVPGATVTVTNTGTDVARTTKTNDVGFFYVASLSPGTYSVTASKTGFTIAKEPDITLQVAQVATLNISLQVGNATQTVEVTTAAVSLEATDATLGSVVPEQEVQDLPLNGRQFSQLLQLAPGTVPIDNSQNAGKAPNFGSGAGSPSVDGQTNRSNIFFLDGIIASNPFFGGFSFSPSVDAIQEFKAQSHTDLAEYGQASGAIVSVVSRPGTNQIHGAAYEFVRNQIFDAKDAFDAIKLPYHQNQFGASFGGPIFKNKLFFFGNYEGGRLVSGVSANLSTVPTDDERAGDFSGTGPAGPLPGNIHPNIYDPSTYNPVTQTEQQFITGGVPNVIPSGRIDAGMLAYLNGVYPKSNQALNSSGQNNYLASTENRTVNDQGELRIDYTPGPNDSLNGHYAQNEATLSSPSSLANLFATGFSGKNMGGNWVHTFNPTLIAEVTGGYNALNIPQAILTPVDQTALFASAGLGAGFNANPGDTPVVLIPGYNLDNVGAGYTGYWNGAGPIGPMHIAQGGVTVTKIAGNHSLKFGASYYHTWMYTNWNGNNEDFSYKGTWNAACQFAGSNETAAAECPTYNAGAGDLGGGGDPVASMLLSVPIDATRNLGNSGVNLIETTPAAFAQDSWKAGRKLTVNFGLRWDYSAPMREKNNRLATYDFQNQVYEVLEDDADMPKGPLPAHVAVLDRHSITTPHYLDFSPRVGLAYQFTPRTTVRVGAGRTFDDWGLPLQVGQQVRGAWPSGLAQQARVNNTTSINTAGLSVKPDGTLATGENPFYGAAVLGASPLPAGGLGFQDTAWVPADSFQWNLEIEQDFRSVGNFSVAYVGSHTTHQTLLQPYDTAPASTTPFSDALIPDQVYDSVGSILRSTAGNNYESFQAKLNRAYANGFTYNAGFTWSKALGLSSCNGDFSNICIQNIYNISKSSGDYGRTDLDIPFIFTFSGTYKLPFGKGERFINTGAAAYILGNWQINTFLSARSGTVLNPTNGANGDTANAGGGSQRVNITGNPNNGPHTKAAWFNASDFSLPADGTYGNAQINSLRGPKYWSDDFSVFRDIPITERLKGQFRFESFDIFNHPNLGNPGGSFGGGGFNTITNTVPVTGPGAQRDIQFAFKLLF